MRSCSPRTSQNFLILQEGHDSAPFNIFLIYFLILQENIILYIVNIVILQGRLDLVPLNILNKLSHSANTLPLHNNYQPQRLCPKPPALLLVLVKPVAWHGL